MDVKIGKNTTGNVSVVKREDALFYIAFLTMVFAKAFGLDSSHTVYYILFAGAGLLLGMRILILLKRRDLGLIGAILLLMIPSGILLLINRETTMLFTCFFLAACKDIDFDTAMRWCFRMFLIAIPLKLCLYFMGIVEGGYKEIWVYVSPEEAYLADITYGYGYMHPNTFFAVVCIAAMLLLYVQRNNIKISTVLAVTAVVVTVFVLTKCKSGMMVYGAVFVGIFIDKVLRKEKLLLSYCGLLVAAALVLGILLPLIHSEENPILHFINHKLVTGRLELARNAIDNVGIHLLRGGNCFSDILYMDTLLNNGLLGFGMLMTGMGTLWFSMVRDKNWVGLVCVSSVALYACMEQFPLNIAMNPFLLYLGTNVIFTSKVKT